MAGYPPSPPIMPLTPIETLLSSMHLNSPLARGIVFAALFSIPVMLFKLPISYAKTEEGFYLPKKWSILSDSTVDPAFQTSLPWFIWPIIGLSVGALLF